MDVTVPSEQSKAVLGWATGLNDWWYVRLPLALDRWFPMVGDALADGLWLALRPRLAALTPIAVFLVGLLSTRLWPGVQYLFSESLSFLMAIVVIPIASGTAGVALLVGYVVGDLLGGTPSPRSGVGFPLHTLGQLVIYLLLALACVQLPQLARRLAEGFLDWVSPDARTSAKLRPLAVGAAWALLVALWSQAAAVLMRPLWTLVGFTPTLEAAFHLQQRWELLALVAAGAAVARVVAERAALARSPEVRRLIDAQGARWERLAQRGEGWQRLPSWVQPVVAAAYVAVLFTGLYSPSDRGLSPAAWLDAALVAGVVGLLGWWRSRGTGLPRVWTHLLDRVPGLLRYAVAVALALGLARYVVERSGFIYGGSFRPLLLAAILSFLAFYVLFPPPRREPPGEEVRP